ncbi:MAG: L-threonine 3-dehydrogenase [Caldisericia bacterium]|nr:L-threonine 3-dehydrogenase [Caldisericia bacterium]MDD4613874.1 L-threonine 3-dehydrogenase [Caldisericia bacterium]
MKRILVTGALGQIGTELSLELRKVYGTDSVVVSYIRERANEILEEGPHETIDTTDANRLKEVVKKYNITQIYHMASILSAKGESNPQMAWDVNMNGLYQILETAREFHCSVFIPSSIAAFGPSSPKDNTPQDTIQRPTSMYGVTKVAGEILCDYYYLKYGLDARGLRYPGIISWKTLPGGGTTDYAVDIYYQAILKKEYTCFLKEDTSLDMMYMPDAVNASIKLMEADPARLIHRNAFNVTAMSMTPAKLAENIKKHIPEFVMKYDIDPVRQSIADSWPNSLNDSAAQKEWDWKPEFTMDMMTKDMLDNLRKKLA